jgi:cyclic pyranopterin phosphate synthase
VKGELTHLDSAGAARMVDVGQKPSSRRTARASGLVRMQPATLERIVSGGIPKGDVIAVARVAGTLAAKRTDEVIPLCHTLPVDAVNLSFYPRGDDCLQVEAEVSTTGKTGVEMEALVAVSVACLTIYDMCKSLDRAMSIDQVRLESKTGGVHGDYHRTPGAEGTT